MYRNNMFSRFKSNFSYHELSCSKSNPSMSKKEWGIIPELKNNNDIIIKEADKKYAVGIMDIEY